MVLPTSFVETADARLYDIDVRVAHARALVRALELMSSSHDVDVLAARGQLAVLEMIRNLVEDALTAGAAPRSDCGPL